MKKKLLVVGQTPPPYHGQAIMIENIVNHQFSELKIFHVRMKFSDGKNIGKFSFRKVFMLPNLILSIIYYRIKYNVKNIYYPPAGPDSIPIIRDIIILLFIRIFFSKIIFHFHAGGVSEKINRSKGVFKYLAKKAYSKPDLTIRLSSRNPNDGIYFNSKRDVIIPYGLKDFYNQQYFKKNLDKPEILYVGVIKKTKGVSDLIEATKFLITKNLNENLNFL